MQKKHYIEIKFCPKCKWLSRATWISQELLSTFESDLSSVTLVPSESGVFDITCSQILIFSRKEEGGFIDVAIIKQRIRDLIDPDRSLGHVDNVR
jgi:selenoprotein W-related protein